MHHVVMGKTCNVSVKMLICLVFEAGNKRTQTSRPTAHPQLATTHGPGCVVGILMHEWMLVKDVLRTCDLSATLHTLHIRDEGCCHALHLHQIFIWQRHASGVKQQAGLISPRGWPYWQDLVAKPKGKPFWQDLVAKPNGRSYLRHYTTQRCCSEVDAL